MIIRYTIPSKEPNLYKSESSSIILGRKPGKDQMVNLDLRGDGYVSHVHACLSYENGEYWVEDLDSENGTWVNDRRIEWKTRLTYGAKIRVGWTIVEIERESQPREADDAVALPLDDATRSFVDTPESDEPPVPDVPLPVAESEVNVLREDAGAKEPVCDEPESDREPTSEGTITSVKNAFTPPFTETEEDPVDDSQKQGWEQLRALNNFIQALGDVTAIDELGQLLVEQFKIAMPAAQRGALLLPDKNGNLLLKAHWPEGEHSVSMTWVNRAYCRQEAFIWTAAPPAENENIDNIPKSAIYFDVQSAIYLPLLSAGEVLGVMYVDNYFIREAFSQTDFELLRAIANQIAMFIRDKVLRENLHREEVLRSDLLRQYSPQIADRIVDRCGRLKRGGEQIDPVTILVSDVRGFTALSAKMEPDEVVRAINEMFDAFVPIISEMNGIVDKYVGDSVLAVFGSPESDPHQWENAVRAAVRMQEAMRMLGEGRRVRRLPVFQVGIGIHSGEVIHGFIGSSERIEFTVIGDTVNRAARYCDGANEGEITISKKVYERVYHLVDVETKTIMTKHPDVEPDLEAYLVKGLRDVGKKPEKPF